MQVCKQIRNLRNNLNLSQARFGMRLGISGKSISAYETGRCLPNIRVLKQISDVFNVDFIEIPSNNRKHILERLENLENCFDELRKIIDDLLSDE